MIKVIIAHRIAHAHGMLMASRRVLRFPLWLYLNQPLFNGRLVLNPKRFWLEYRNAYLERCWKQEYTSKGEPSC